MTVETGVSGILCASHRDRLTGTLHGHTWRVTAWVDGAIHRDGQNLQERLKGILRAWDHTVLPDELASGEAIVAAIAHLLGDCSEVLIERPLEGYAARWRP